MYWFLIYEFTTSFIYWQCNTCTQYILVLSIPNTHLTWPRSNCCVLPKEAKTGWPIPWSWRIMWLQATVWVLESEPRSCARASVVIWWEIPPAPKLYFLMRPWISFSAPFPLSHQFTQEWTEHFWKFLSHTKATCLLHLLVLTVHSAQPRVAWEGEPQLRNCPDQTVPPACLCGIFWAVSWCGRARPTHSERHHSLGRWSSAM